MLDSNTSGSDDKSGESETTADEKRENDSGNNDETADAKTLGDLTE